MEAFDVRGEDVLLELAVSRQLIREVLRDITGALYVSADNVRHDSFEETSYTLLERDGRYSVATYQGVAFWYAGDDVETVEEWIVDAECDHDPWEDCTWECGHWETQERLTGMVWMVMVGDDHRHLVDPEDCSPLDRADYCGVCGQVGCCHDGYDREGG